MAAAALGRRAGAAKFFARLRRADLLRACGARGRRVRPPSTVAVCVSVSGVRGAQKCAFALGRDGVRGVASGQENFIAEMDGSRRDGYGGAGLANRHT